MKRRWSSALLAAVAEAAPRLRSIGQSHTEANRIRRAEDRDLPQWPRKEQAQCCLARRDAENRLPVGFCSPECERRPA